MFSVSTIMIIRTNNFVCCISFREPKLTSLSISSDTKWSCANCKAVALKRSFLCTWTSPLNNVHVPVTWYCIFYSASMSRLAEVLQQFLCQILRCFMISRQIEKMLFVPLCCLCTLQQPKISSCVKPSFVKCNLRFSNALESGAYLRVT